AEDLKPIDGITAFGGAEKQIERATGIGGLDLVGLYPLTKDIGLQGNTTFSGGRGFRFGLSGGPVANFTSGKAGLFVDYSHLDRIDYNLVNIRGVGAYYLGNVDLVFSYSHPVSSVKRKDGDKFAGINELQALGRFYPTQEIEVSAGVVVNSFAGAGHRDDGGTGVGGLFGVSFKVFDPLVIQLVQGQVDNRDRYRVTSGVQLIFGSPLRDWIRSHIFTPPGVSGGG